MATPLQSTRPVTWRHFVELDDEDRRELVEGQLLAIDMPTALHEWIVSRLIILLGNWGDQTGRGFVIGSGYRVRISETEGYQPDVQFYLTGSQPLPQQGLETGAPLLVVEVISPSSGRYDRVEKLRGYARIGVREYWIVDADRKTLERLVLQASGHYEVVEARAGDDSFSPSSFPGLTIPLSRLWTMPAGLSAAAT